jgi:hypothetical protein
MLSVNMLKVVMLSFMTPIEEAFTLVKFATKMPLKMPTTVAVTVITLASLGTVTQLGWVQC